MRRVSSGLENANDRESARTRQNRLRFNRSPVDSKRDMDTSEFLRLVMTTAANIPHARTKLVSTALVSVSFALVLVVLIPLAPLMPSAGLDPSWMYALNQAVANHLVFGRDLVFTFGPFGSVYTQMYHPATDGFMLAGSLITAAGLWAAILLISRSKWTVILLPFAIVLAWSPDAVFMAIPLGLLFAAYDTSNGVRLDRSRAALLAIVLIAIGLLPLIKASFSGVAGGIGAVSVAMLAYSRRWRSCLVIVLLPASALVMGWILTGQPLAALPLFFKAQQPVIAGYTEAMSMEGPAVLTKLSAGCAIIMLAAFFWSIRKNINGYLVCLGIAGYLFITFKAGFVRQPGHSTIAAGSLLFLSMAIAPRVSPRVAALVLCAVFFTWLRIARHETNLDLSNVFERFKVVATRFHDGVTWRTYGTLPIQFEQAKAAIQKAYPLPQFTGTADVYPYDIVAVLARDKLKWAGRPIPQSYTAYMPELDRKNAEWLRSPHAPETVLWSWGPIDGRYTTLDDASSWPILMSRYKLVDSTAQFLVMRRNADSKDAIERRLLTVDAKLDESVNVPRLDRPVLAAIDMKETPLGKVMKAVYRLPDIFIEVTLENGAVLRSRYIPNMGKTGFIISPFVGSLPDLKALVEGSERLRVTRMKIIAPDGAYWQKDIKITWSTFDQP
jgi:hypothetical protein